MSKISQSLAALTPQPATHCGGYPAVRERGEALVNRAGDLPGSSHAIACLILPLSREG